MHVNKFRFAVWDNLFFFLLFILFFCSFANAKLTCPTDRRQYDGSCTNLEHADWAKAGSLLIHPEGLEYVDGVQVARGENVSLGSYPPVRALSVKVFASPRDHEFADDTVNQWAISFFKIVLHDMVEVVSLSGLANLLTYEMRVLTTGEDPMYQPVSLGFMLGAGRVPGFLSPVTGQRETPNNVTATIDLSPVYGSDEITALLLRTMVDGKLKTSAGNMPPLSTSVPGVRISFNPSSPFPKTDFGGNSSILYAAGDARVNQDTALTLIHILMLRNHNWWVDKIVSEEPGKNYTDEELYWMARENNTAEYSAILYEELLPLFLAGYYHPGEWHYRGYRSDVDPTAGLGFEAVGGRLFHSTVLKFTDAFDNCGNNFTKNNDSAPVHTMHTVGNPAMITGAGPDPFLRGQFLASGGMDIFMSDDVRNLVLSCTQIPLGPGLIVNNTGVDVISLDLVRGREFGVVNYDALQAYYRESSHGKTFYDAYHACKVTESQATDTLACFEKLTSNSTLAQLLLNMYSKIDRIDPMVGVFAEKKKTKAYLPPTGADILIEQFQRSRDGNWWWYENVENGLFSPHRIQKLRRTKVSDLLQRNFPNVACIPRDAFEADLESLQRCWSRQSCPQPEPGEFRRLLPECSQFA